MLVRSRRGVRGSIGSSWRGSEARLGSGFHARHPLLVTQYRLAFTNSLDLEEATHALPAYRKLSAFLSLLRRILLSSPT